MNKNNKVLVGVLALIVAMTIGYALFSDNITITGTAKAKGDFSLKVTCSPGINSEIDALADDMKVFNWISGDASYSDAASLLAAYPENNYSNDTCVVEDNNVKFHVDLLQPGARRYFTVKVVNDGSIPIAGIEPDAGSNPIITGTITQEDGNLKELGNDQIANDSIEQFAGVVGNGFSFSKPDYAFVTGDSMYLVYVINCPEKLSDIYHNGDYFNRAKAFDLKIDYNTSITFTQLTQ